MNETTKLELDQLVSLLFGEQPAAFGEDHRKRLNTILSQSTEARDYYLEQTDLQSRLIREFQDSSENLDSVSKDKLNPRIPDKTPSSDASQTNNPVRLNNSSNSSNSSRLDSATTEVHIVSPNQLRSRQSPSRRSRWSHSGLAKVFLVAGLLAILVFGAWLAISKLSEPAPDITEDQRRQSPIQVPEIRISSQWKIEPIGETEIEVISPLHVRIIKGEAYVTPANIDDLNNFLMQVETSDSISQTENGSYFISCAVDDPSTSILVEDGSVELFNSHGKVVGEGDSVLVSENGNAPIRWIHEGNAKLSCDLFQLMLQRHSEDSFCFSPLSIATGLSILLEGAQGKTAEEIVSVLNLPTLPEDALKNYRWQTLQISSGYRKLFSQRRFSNIPEIQAKLKKIDRLELEYSKMTLEDRSVEKRNIFNEITELRAQVNKFRMVFGNGFFGPKLIPEFEKLVNDHYSSPYRGLHRTGVEGVFRFKENPSPPLRGKSTNIRSASLTLQNVLTLSSNWHEPFDEANTQKGPFELSDGSFVESDMMSGDFRSSKYAFFNREHRKLSVAELNRGDNRPDGYEVVELAFQDHAFSAVIVVPQESSAIDNLAKQVSPELLNKWFNEVENQSVELTFPKFDCWSRHGLNKILVELGIKTFDINNKPKNVELGKLVRGDDFDELSFSFRHTSRITVSEKGIRPYQILYPDEIVESKSLWTPKVAVNRPFLMILKENEGNTISHIALVKNPNHPRLVN